MERMKMKKSRRVFCSTIAIVALNNAGIALAIANDDVELVILHVALIDIIALWLGFLIDRTIDSVRKILDDER